MTASDGPSRRGQVLIFDLGGVLIASSGREKLTALLREGEAGGDVRLRWLACKVVQQFERGRISRDEFAAALVEEWGIDLAPNVAAARALGMHAVRVEGLAQVREVLLMEGLA